jgi:predicted dithiol-disulfide oxidoreductase (DUF899 family)
MSIAFDSLTWEETILMTDKTKQETAAASMHSVRFPGESAGYRKARDRLLKAEIALRRNIEKVAALRRKLPPGGPVPHDYEFEEGPANLAGSEMVRRVKLSDLFVLPDASLIVYSFMYGPAMQRPCPSCTSILDGLDGVAPHVTQRVNLAVVAKSPVERIRAFARERGWRNLRLVSSSGNSYNHDYHGETDKGSQIPALNVFVRRGGEVRHYFSTELLYAPFDPGQDGRHVDLIWPLWNLFDFTPEGRGKDWHPKLSYA